MRYINRHYLSIYLSIDPSIHPSIYLIYLLPQYACYSAAISEDLIVEWLLSAGPLAMT